MKKILLFAVTAALISAASDKASAATPSGFATAILTLSAQVNIACEEAQHGAFPPLVIDTTSATDQTFAPTTDEAVQCTNGTVFTIKVTSANGTAVNQTCTSGGINTMALRSTSTPVDTIAYTFLCGGDTDGSGHFTGAGFATARALGMSIKVLAANAQSAMAHADYSDTVTLTISY